MKKRNSTYYCLLLILMICSSLTKNSFAQRNSNISAVQEINLSSLDWKLWGYRIDSWRKNFDFAQLRGDRAEYMDISVKVPGSVQKALKDAGIISDWNIGTNSTSNEWIENRHWLFVTPLPDSCLKNGNEFILHCNGLDQKGLIYVNGKEVGNKTSAEEISSKTSTEETSSTTADNKETEKISKKNTDKNRQKKRDVQDLCPHQKPYSQHEVLLRKSNPIRCYSHWRRPWR